MMGLVQRDGLSFQTWLYRGHLHKWNVHVILPCIPLYIFQVTTWCGDTFLMSRKYLFSSIPTKTWSNDFCGKTIGWKAQRDSSGQMEWYFTSLFHQPGFPWNKGISLTKPPFGGPRSCEVAIIWPDSLLLGKNVFQNPFLNLKVCDECHPCINITKDGETETPLCYAPLNVTFIVLIS